MPVILLLQRYPSFPRWKEEVPGKQEYQNAADSDISWDSESFLKIHLYRMEQKKNVTETEAEECAQSDSIYQIAGR